MSPRCRVLVSLSVHALEGSEVLGSNHDSILPSILPARPLTRSCSRTSSRDAKAPTASISSRLISLKAANVPSPAMFDMLSGVPEDRITLP